MLKQEFPQMVIAGWVVIGNGVVSRNNSLIKKYGDFSPEQLYADLNCNYPKFFKMDKLCKLAIVAAECLFSGSDALYNGLNKNKIAVALTTLHGCLDVDERFYETSDVPSPALFVYTLPNIMLGEICIRYSFKGEQVCLVTDRVDPDELHFAVTEFFKKNTVDACLCGWVDESAGKYEACICWVTKNGNGMNFTINNLRKLNHG